MNKQSEHIRGKGVKHGMINKETIEYIKKTIISQLELIRFISSKE